MSLSGKNYVNNLFVFRDIVSRRALVSLPGLMVPGQYAMAGSLMPPSYVVPLPHFSGPEFPPRDIRISSGLHTETLYMRAYKLKLSFFQLFIKTCCS